jgi:hypothetical protein
MPAMTGGAKMEKFLQETARKVSNPGVMQVGFMSDAKYEDGTSVAMVAAIQNFGSPAMGIPPRPFFTDMIRRHRGAWPGQLVKALKAHDMDAHAALVDMGKLIEGELLDQIIETVSPPLSPVTLMLRAMRIGKRDEDVTFAMVQEARARVAAGEQPKGLTASDFKPLVYSGNLLKSITSVVE